MVVSRLIGPVHLLQEERLLLEPAGGGDGIHSVVTHLPERAIPSQKRIARPALGRVCVGQRIEGRRIQRVRLRLKQQRRTSDRPLRFHRSFQANQLHGIGRAMTVLESVEIKSWPAAKQFWLMLEALDDAGLSLGGGGCDLRLCTVRRAGKLADEDA